MLFYAQFLGGAGTRSGMHLSLIYDRIEYGSLLFFSNFKSNFNSLVPDVH